MLILYYTQIYKKNINSIDNRFLRRLPPPIRLRLQEIIFRGDKQLTMPELEMLCEKYDVPFHFVLEEMNFYGENKSNPHNKKLAEFGQHIQSEMNVTILYLPTYRRIEQELGLIFKDLDEDKLRSRDRRHYLNSRNKASNYLELIEFGMKDVDSAIRSTLEELKDFARENLNKLTLGYLSDVVDQKYTQVDVTQIQKASKETIKNVLDRIDEKILSELSKSHLSETISSVRTGTTLDDHAKVICHYFIKLLNFQQELEKKESKIREFCRICNKYLASSNKEFEYFSSSFNFLISANTPGKERRKIDIHNLSSGEKQIVSLFSHLYLSEKRKYFVMIDEPELSLSVPWQRLFLADIHDSEFCAGMLAVTHSPFIYDNSLKTYTHGLGEFMQMEKI